MPSPYLDVVDLDRFPIDDLRSAAGAALVARCRQQLADEGACTLPGFVRPAAVDAMVELAERLSDRAWASDQSHTVYFDAVDRAVPPSDPRALLVRSAKKGIAYDHIPPDAPLRRLYESDDMTRFVAAVLGKERLYRSDDPLDAFQITRFDAGDELGWHFDRSEFSVTVMYQPSAAGGHFDYVPAIRSGTAENYPEVEQVLRGTGRAPVRLRADPGTLAVFHGHRALHRVTPVGGTRPRVNSVLTYGEQPGMRLNALTSMLFYGRSSGPSAA